MEIIETIPIYTSPNWLMWAFIIAGILFAICLLSHNNDSTVIVIMGVVSAVILIASLVIAKVGWLDTYNHDEYIVKVNDISAIDFYKDYTLVKTFEYSDVWQVKRKEN